MDVSRMTEEGWKYNIELVDGIRRTYDWFLDNVGNVKEVKL
jgi:GDP-L-fucose synthase